MFRRLFSSLLSLVFLSLAYSSPLFAVERRVALVIGNAKYKDGALLNPVNDANDMEAALKASGFQVIKALDASQKQMNRAIAQFGELLTQDSVALFYYAGHGLQVRGKNYLIPVDAEIKSESMIRVESVDVDGVLDQLSGSELNVVILDACRNNPYERRASRSLGGVGLAQMEAPKGSLIAYSTAPGRTAADGDGRNGIYTQALLRYIRTPGLTIEEVFKNVRKDVSRVTRDAQMPWESSSMTGEFYFSPVGRQSIGSNLPAPVRPPEKPAALDAPAPVELSQPRTPTSGMPAPADSSAPLVAAAALALSKAEAPLAVAEPKALVITADTFTATGKLVVDGNGAMTGDPVVIAWTNGERYEGAMLSGKKQGRGVFIWPNGQRYEGEWADDLINGFGLLSYANGDRYEGAFINGEPHGQGTYRLQNGDVYVGEWLAGNKHGQGRLTWAGGDYWEGEFRDDQQTSNGKLIYGQSAEAPASEPAAVADRALAAKKAPRRKGK